mgnify:CR=1 FL=1
MHRHVHADGPLPPDGHLRRARRGRARAARRSARRPTTSSRAAGGRTCFRIPQVKAFNARVEGRDRERSRSGTTRCAYETVRVLVTALGKASSLEARTRSAARSPSVDLTDSILPGGGLKFSRVGPGDPPVRRHAEQARRQGGHRLAGHVEDRRSGRASAEELRTWIGADSRLGSRDWKMH